MVRTSVIPNKLKEELEDVGKVYNSRSGMCVYPNAFSRLQTEIVKVCNENKELEKAKEIIKEYIRINLLPPIERNFDDEVKLFKQAEQFLSEVGK